MPRRKLEGKCDCRDSSFAWKLALENYPLPVCDFRFASWLGAALGQLERDELTVNTRQQHARAVILLHAWLIAGFDMEFEVGRIGTVASDNGVRSVKPTHGFLCEVRFFRRYGCGRRYWKGRFGDRHCEYFSPVPNVRNGRTLGEEL